MVSIFKILMPKCQNSWQMSWFSTKFRTKIDLNFSSTIFFWIRFLAEIQDKDANQLKDLREVLENLDVADDSWIQKIM